MRNVFYFSKKVRLFSQNDVFFLFYFLINPAGTTVFLLSSSVEKLRDVNILVEKAGILFVDVTVFARRQLRYRRIRL